MINFSVNKELLKKLYPTYNESKGYIQRYSIFPIDVYSQHNGEKVIFTKKAAESIIEQLPNTPFLFAEDEDEELPQSHSNDDGERDIIGTVLGGGTLIESGVEWVYADVLIFKAIDEETYKLIVENSKSVGASIEAEVSVDNENYIHEATLTGISLVDNNRTAWRTRLLVADKGEPQQVLITYDDIIKQIITNDYESQIKNKELELDTEKKTLESKKIEFEQTLIEKEETIKRLTEENAELMKLNQNFSKLF